MSDPLVVVQVSFTLFVAILALVLSGVGMWEEGVRGKLVTILGYALMGIALVAIWMMK